MANPRKFSEKIALHNQKQAAETAAFEQIMREVSDATAKVILKYIVRSRSIFFWYPYIMVLLLSVVSRHKKFSYCLTGGLMAVTPVLDVLLF